MKNFQFSQKGSSLAVVLLFVFFMTLISAYILQYMYNQKRLSDQASGKRLIPYYRAKAGVVDAQWRIRSNAASEIGVPTGNFNDKDFDPPAYYIDLDSNMIHLSKQAVDDVRVDIGPVDARTGVREIQATGFDD